jgi:hypothetical protein
LHQVSATFSSVWSVSCFAGWRFHNKFAALPIGHPLRSGSSRTSTATSSPSTLSPSKPCHTGNPVWTTISLPVPGAPGCQKGRKALRIGDSCVAAVQETANRWKILHIDTGREIRWTMGTLPDGRYDYGAPWEGLHRRDFHPLERQLASLHHTWRCQLARSRRSRTPLSHSNAPPPPYARGRPFRFWQSRRGGPDRSLAPLRQRRRRSPCRRYPTPCHVDIVGQCPRKLPGKVTSERDWACMTGSGDDFGTTPWLGKGWPGWSSFAGRGERADPYQS